MQKPNKTIILPSNFFIIMRICSPSSGIMVSTIYLNGTPSHFPDISHDAFSFALDCQVGCVDGDPLCALNGTPIYERQSNTWLMFFGAT